MRLVAFDEARDLETQMQCQSDLDGLLNRLVRVVINSHLPSNERLSLIDGIAHLRGHLHTETSAMRAEMQFRRN